MSFYSVIAANALPGTQYRLRLGGTQAQVDGDGTALYNSSALPFISPAIESDDGLYHSHLELGAIVTAFWWRIDIIGHAGSRQPAWYWARQ